MKKICFIGLMSLVIFSCRKNFLELPPPSNANVFEFYKNATDMEVALTAAYAALQSDGQYRGSNWQVGEVRSDNTYNWEGGGNLPDAEIDQFKESASNSILNTMWLDTYHGILLCNILIGRIGAIPMDEDLKKRYVGETKFLRALMYFNLVRTFGDVPLVLKETTAVQEGYTQKRIPASQVYDQIILDLNDAAAILPAKYTGPDIGRATSGAAKSLLGKVFLTQGKYESAVSVLEDVISTGTYHLLTNYADLWRTSNANHPESIFEVQYKKGGSGAGSPYTNLFAPRGSDLAVTIVGFAYGKNLPTTDLVAAYESGDLRKNASLSETYMRNGQTIYDPYTIKYSDVPFVELDADNNWTVLRYADVMLMYAEALNEINGGPTSEAYNMINAVRHRAGLAALPNTLDKNAFALAMEHERQVELAFEGHRWFDLIRTGRAVDVMNAHFHGVITIQSYQLLFPVPQSQININPSVITQNEGY